MTDPRTLTVLEPPIMDIVRQTATDTISIYDGSFVTGAIALTDQGLVLSLSNSTGTELVLSVTENVNEDPGPTDNLFVLQDTAAVGTGQFFATVEFPVAPGTSQRTLAFVPDSATKPGGLLDIQVRVEEPLIQSQTILAILVIEITPEGSGDPGGDPGSEAPEILSFTGQFDALTVQSPGQITVPHGIEGNLEAVGNTDSDSIRIEESTVEVDAFGAPVGTPTTSVVAVGLTGTDPPTLETTLAPPVDTSVILRRELTAIPLDTAGDPGISSTFTVTYEPAAALTLEITNLNPLGDMGNTVTSEDTSLVIGTVAGEPVRVALSSASEAQLLTLYQDEVVIAEEVGPVTRLPALPGTFIDVTMPPGSPFGTRIVLRGESLVDVGGNPVSTSTSNIEIQADNRPAVTNLTADSAFGIDAGGGNLSEGFIDVSFDFADPDEFEFDTVDTITLRAVSDNGPSGQLDVTETRTFGLGSSIGEFHGFTFDASAGMNIDSQVTVTATPVDSFGLPGATASITFRLGDALTP